MKIDPLVITGCVVIAAVLLVGLWMSTYLIRMPLQSKECPQVNCTCSCDGDQATLHVDAK